MRWRLLPGRHAAGAATALLIRIVSAAIAFLGQVQLARWLGAVDFGVLTALLVWVNVLGTVSTLGFATSVLRFLPQYLTQGALPLARGFHRTGMLAALLAGTAIAALGLLLLSRFTTLLPAPYAVPARMALLALPAFALADFLDGVGRSRGWVVLALAPPFIIRPLMILLGVGLLELSRAPLGAAGATLVAAAAIWISALAQLALQARPFRAAVRSGPPAYDPGLWIRVSLPMLLLDGVALLLLNIDIILLGFFVGPGEIARYFAAQRIISLVCFIHFAAAAAAVSHFATSHVAGDRHALRQSYGRCRALAFYPSLILAIGLLALGKPLLLLFGADFVSAWPVMAILGLGLMARGAAGPAQSLLVSTGHHHATVLVLCTTLFANCCLGIALIPRHGLIGAALASMAAMLVESAMFALLQHRLFAGPPPPLKGAARHGVDQPAA
ncbi:MAG: lipopolysaccharide biosynthesis protein [Aestuariivirgaceae bacterium]